MWAINLDITAATSFVHTRPNSFSLENIAWVLCLHFNVSLFSMNYADCTKYTSIFIDRSISLYLANFFHLYKVRILR